MVTKKNTLFFLEVIFIRKFMTEDEQKFVEEFGWNLRALMSDIGENIKEFSEDTMVSSRTIQRYLSKETIPNLSSVNNIIVGLGFDYDDIITLSERKPVDWTRQKIVESSITDDDRWRIDGLQQSVLYFAAGAPTNMDVINNAKLINGEWCITQSEYKKALSKGLRHLITRPDGEGGRTLMENMDILAKSMLIPKRDLYRYLDGTRTISTLHAFNILNFFGVRPQALLGNFKCFVIEDEYYD